MEVKEECYDALYKTVSTQRSAGVIYTPKNWAGKKVRVLLLEPVEE